MIDLHCHIIPVIDDGPKNLLESIDMANMAVRAGITDLFATPHHLNEKYVNPKHNILHCVNEFNKYLQQKNIPLTVHPGQELRIHYELLSLLEKDEILTLGNQGQYVLIELPSNQVPIYTQEIIYELLVKGMTPIIVHPERNKGLIENHNLLFELVQEGALTQLTTGSILGQFGKKVKSFSRKIVEHHLTHFIATDAHNIHSRGFFLIEAYETITKQFGIDQTYYFQENAKKLLSGQKLQIEQPVLIRKKILGVF